MSEELLRTIVQLFALLAKEDELDQSERKTIEEFLAESLNDQAVAEYLSLFDNYIEKYHDISSKEEEEALRSIAENINRQLTHQQKIVLILDVVEMILADGIISKEEERLFYTIGEKIKVNKVEIEAIKDFLLNREESDFYGENTLIVDDGTSGDHNAFHIKRENFDGFLVFLRLPSVETYFVRYFGKLDLTLNGSPLRFGRTAVFPTGSSIRTPKLDPIYYSDIVSYFLAEKGDAEISYIAEKISYQFSNGKLGLRDIDIFESQGSLVGIMGASGSGKSTLLNVLNGVDSPTSGTVKINGLDLHKEPEKLKGIIGYVPQDDLLLEDLSVYQNLYYAAKLCFKDATEEEVDQLVVKTLKNLGLMEASDLKVGSPLQKTISGGQRKRLNIGLELLREPGILFVDEPTSGLSSRDSENIMDLLKELSLRGKLIFVVIHQPSSDIYKMFDRLVILDVGGYQIYYGNPLEAVVYFRSIINMVNSDESECALCGNVNPEQIFNIIETRIINEYGHLTEQRKISPPKWNEYFKQKINLNKPDETNAAPKSSLRIPNLIEQTRIFTIRDILSKISNKQYLLINLLEAPVLAVILAYIIRFYPHDGTYLFGKNPNIPAYFFMSIIVALFMGLTVSAEEILKDRKILKREAFLSLSWGSYLTSKLMLLFGLSAIQTLSFVVVGNLILGLHDVWFLQWAILFTTSCFANLLGLNISSAFNSAVTIYILIPILLIPQLLLSGVVVQFDKLNPQITTNDKVPFIGELMTSRWAFEGLMTGQFLYNSYEKTFYPYDQVKANAEYKTVYYLHELESILEYVGRNMLEDNGADKTRVDQRLSLLRKELQKEIDIIGGDHFPEINKLSREDFNSAVYEKTKAFIQDLSRYYNRKFINADKSRDQRVKEWLDNHPDQEFLDFRSEHQNEAVATLVKNTNDAVRIINEEDQIIRKVYPIYVEHQSPSHALDFRGQFYLPEKHFAGSYISTPLFNILFIWLFGVILYVMLYFDLLRKAVERFS